MPHSRRGVLYLPQKPFFTDGTLRQQVGAVHLYDICGVVMRNMYDIQFFNWTPGGSTLVNWEDNRWQHPSGSFYSHSVSLEQHFVCIADSDNNTLRGFRGQLVHTDR